MISIAVFCFFIVCVGESIMGFVDITVKILIINMVEQCGSSLGESCMA